MGRKMAAVFQASSEGSVLYGDVDLLWFRRPAQLDGWASEAGPVLAMSTDPDAAYDRQVVERAYPELRERPYYCAGVMYAHGRVFEDEKLQGLLEYAAEEGIGITEQAIFAGRTRELGGRRFPEDEIFLWDGDRLTHSSTFPGKPWAARHYVGQVRHLFWRDAYSLGRRVRRAGL